jgi:type VI secretion system protein ImpC
MPGRIEFTMGFNTQKAAFKEDGDRGFRIYILGNFSGRSDLAWEQRKIRRITIDSFDSVMTQIMPSLEISPGAILRFETLDDFHPDAWLKRVPILADLLQLKKELSNPSTASQAAAKIRAFLPADTKNETAIQQQEATESQEEMLERLLGRKPERATGGTDAMDKYIDQVVSPHVTKDAEPRHQALIKVIDTTISQFLLTVLHRPDFQALEALWRASEALVNEESTDQQNFFLVDISQAELLAEHGKGSRAVEQTLLQHVRSGDGEQDIVLIGDYCFSDSADDRALLIFCSRLAQACGADFLGAAGHALIENTIFGEAENLGNWEQYLKQICADRIVLAYPRYLQRLPYGAKREPIEALAFEECPDVPRNDELLWGNPAFLCARILIRNRQEQQADESCFLEDIPAFAFDQDGEQVLQPGTEIVLNEAQANALVSQGVTPLLGFRQRQGVRLLPITTLSEHS